ncbi:Hypp8340 [Branchiostoma lanceolatum]|uniref:Hypp8340 protein n=1 Tax=Branchiostoma lanceolatum TaxID=7740 RepID=A0A8K0EEH3_BRALA|nr:Hypp8340 [Branchiostoma lanceolatum]
MALPSNAQANEQGQKLKFFSPYPTDGADGVNVFTQDIADRKVYVFPPYHLIPATLAFLLEQKADATIVVPDFTPRLFWYGIVNNAEGQDSLQPGKGKTDLSG